MSIALPALRRLGLLVLPALLGVMAPAAAPAATASQSFGATGEHAFVVPNAVTSVQVTLTGAAGGAGTGNTGGLGATVGATLAVTPGQTLYAEVGGNGIAATAGTSALGGLGGGGAGGAAVLLFVGAPGGGGGGGSSDVRTCTVGAVPASCPGETSLASRLVVAGGGAPAPRRSSIPTSSSSRRRATEAAEAAPRAFRTAPRPTLAPGRYRVTAIATDAAGRASKARTARATVLR